MLVVRLERRGRGIFRPSNNVIQKYRITQNVYDRHAKFPTPRKECLNMSLDDKEWFCGYKSIDELQSWVYSDEIKFFISKGFKVLLLEVTEFQLGEHQIIFTKESITSSKDITSLFNN